ncbi:MAG: M12 family metallopeptidase [Vicinamibacterales bacterium]
MLAPKTALPSALLAGLFAVSGNGMVAQQAPVIDDAPFIRIDDQLFDRDLAEFQVVSGDGQLRPRTAAPVDASQGDRFGTYDLATWGGWDYGVIPYEFSPGISAARRVQFLATCGEWGADAPIRCVERTSQLGFVQVTGNAATTQVSPCYAFVGQGARLRQYVLNLGEGCWAESVINHEFGHALGLWHEHQRPDRDAYVEVDLSSVPEAARYAYSTVNLRDPLGPYDFLSIMHYVRTAFSSNGQTVMTPREGYGSFANSMGTSTKPTQLDRHAVASFYRTAMRPMAVTAPVQAPRTRFDRIDFLDAMERLNAFYASPMGLNRDAGLSIGGGPDFLGIATWIFDVYLAARSRGFGKEQSFQIVVADITQTGEWQQKHPGERPLSRPGFTPVVSFDRAEFLNVLRQLDTFYRAPEGLQRPDGLSINGGPDFLGIASWVFDVYLNERLSGGSPNVAWLRVVNAIQATDEWKGKHGR